MSAFMVVMTTFAVSFFVAVVAWILYEKWFVPAQVVRQRKMERLRRFHRPPRSPDHPALKHLTQEQWNAHKSAFADYSYGVGKYRNFEGAIPDWLQSEGLPPTPPVTLQGIKRDYEQLHEAASRDSLKIARTPHCLAA